MATQLDIGITDFMKWLSSLENNDNNSTDCPVFIKEFVKDRYLIFYDKELLKDVIVFFKDCIPWCNHCEADDCGHAGFAICLKQYYTRNGSIQV